MPTLPTVPDVVPEASEGHDWRPLDPGSRYYYCARCRISGKVAGSAWPPIRDPKFIAAEYRTCDGAKRQQVIDDLKKYGLTADDIEL